MVTLIRLALMSVAMIAVFMISTLTSNLAGAAELGTDSIDWQQWQRTLHVLPSHVSEKPLMHSGQDLLQQPLQQELPSEFKPTWMRSDAFFLTPINDNLIDVVAEFQQTRQHLEAALHQQQQGFSTSHASIADNRLLDDSLICRWPYRFRLITENQTQQNQQLRAIQQRCTWVADVEEMAEQVNIQLVFVDEQSYQVTSMMGHLALQIDFPEAFDWNTNWNTNWNTKGQLNEDGLDPLSNQTASWTSSWTLSFFTLITSANLFRQMLNAMGMGGVGELRVYPSAMIDRQYLQNEQRSLWKAKVNMSREDKVRFLLHLHEILEQPMLYSYLDYNCGTALIDLLHVASPSFGRMFADLQHYRWQTPLEFFQQAHARGLLEEARFFPSEARLVDKPIGAETNGAYENQAHNASSDEGSSDKVLSDKVLSDKGLSFMDKPKNSSWGLAAAMTEEQVQGIEDNAHSSMVKTGLSFDFTLSGQRLHEPQWHEFEESSLSLLSMEGQVWQSNQQDDSEQHQDQHIQAQLNDLTLYAFDYRPSLGSSMQKLNASLKSQLGWRRVVVDVDETKTVQHRFSPHILVGLGYQQHWHRTFIHAGIDWQYIHLGMGQNHLAHSPHQWNAIPNLDISHYLSDQIKLSSALSRVHSLTHPALSHWQWSSHYGHRLSAEQFFTMVWEYHHYDSARRGFDENRFKLGLRSYF